MARDISETIDRVNLLNRHLQIVAGNAVHFSEGFEITYQGIATWYYDETEYDYATGETTVIKPAKDVMAAAVRAIRREIKGTAEKSSNDYHFQIKVTNGDLTFVFRTSRKSVCTKTVVGTKMVEKIDYDKAPKMMVSEDIIEWQCDPILEAAAE